MMPLPETEKKYLIVFCKSCDKGFRVLDRPIGDDEKLDIQGAQSLTCRGCGHVAMYDPREMRRATVGPKPASKRN